MKKNLLIFLTLISGVAQGQLADFGKIDFHKADSIANYYEGETLVNLPILSHKLTVDLATEAEKFRAIYTWVCKNIENDHGAYLKNKVKRTKLQGDDRALEEWNSAFTAKVFRTLLKEQKTVCTGYAYLVKELAHFAGIECKIIDGYGRTPTSNVNDLSIPNHSWNAVRLNEKWYLCDATWSSGAYDLQERRFIKDYHDGYFLADPELFSLKHYPLDTAWLLNKEPFTLNEFLNAPLVYKHAFQYGLSPVSPDGMRIEVAKNQEVAFVFKMIGNSPIKDIKLVAGTQNQALSSTIQQNEDGLLEIKHTFKRTGLYDIHVKVQDNFIATYTVRVKKKG